ncbi:MAG: di-trans,poly-cis-decaprenylcistransferase [Phycisphaerales bacterium]|nr:MAG: di-trans,poly-cis-decaprenylcistransferase [Phycisphaerales bacterium]
MRRINPYAEPAAHLPDVPPSRVPRHVAIIMDGNGRWAIERKLPRAAGHRAGAEAVRRTIELCGRIGVEVVTLYSFSLDNWKRPRDEIDALMALYLESLRTERERLVEKNIRFTQIGRREGLPDAVLHEIDATLEATRACTGPTLCLAVNYGGRAEIVDACRTLARRVLAGELKPGDIDEAALDAALYTAGLPDPDLLIRSAGEMRVSNYLLWQISYAELHVTEAYWPDFGPEHLFAAVRDYASRNRRFGGVDHTNSDPALPR